MSSTTVYIASLDGSIASNEMLIRGLIQSLMKSMERFPLTPWALAQDVDGAAVSFLHVPLPGGSDLRKGVAVHWPG